MDDNTTELGERLSKANALAAKAIELYSAIDKLSSGLDKIKTALRELAQGEKLVIEVPSQGVVTISTPRAASTKTVYAVDEQKLDGVPDIKTRLLKAGIITETEKVSPAAAASVSVKLNV